MDVATGFSFDFADLFPHPAAVGEAGVELKVLDGGSPLPAGAQPVIPVPAPRWLPPLLPVFPAGQSLRVGVAIGGAPTFGAILRDSLAGVFAAAGAGSGIAVTAWEQGFLVSCDGRGRMPGSASIHLVAADLTRASLAQTALALSLLPAERTLLVLNGRLPGLERWLGPPPATAIRRLPLIGRAELEAARRSLPAGLASRRYGRACLALAVELVRSHRAGQP